MALLTVQYDMSMGTPSTKACFVLGKGGGWSEFMTTRGCIVADLLRSGRTDQVSLECNRFGKCRYQNRLPSIRTVLQLATLERTLTSTSADVHL